MEKTRKDEKQEKEVTEIYREMKGGRAESGTNQQRKLERKQ